MINDILAMLLVGVVTSLQSRGGINTVHLLLVLAQAVGFIVIIGVFGTGAMRRSSPWLDSPANPFSPLTISLVLRLGLAATACYLGLAGIIGFLGRHGRRRDTTTADFERGAAAYPGLYRAVFCGDERPGGLGLACQRRDPSLGALLVVTCLAVVGKLLAAAASSR